MNALPDYHALLHTLNQHKNPERSLSMKAYMKHHFEFLGIDKPTLTHLTKPWVNVNKKDNSTKIHWQFITDCWQCAYRELQYCALMYLQNRKHLLTDDDLPQLKQLILHKSWWDSIDTLDRIVGDVALRYPAVNDTLLAWSTDDNLWLRRVAIDHQLLRKERTNTKLLEQIILNNLGSQEFFINKAIGWALRDYSKTNADWVRQFIAQHKANMARLSIREASKYL